MFFYIQTGFSLQISDADDYLGGNVSQRCRAGSVKTMAAGVKLYVALNKKKVLKILKKYLFPERRLIQDSLVSIAHVQSCARFEIEVPTDLLLKDHVQSCEHFKKDSN